MEPLRVGLAVSGNFRENHKLRGIGGISYCICISSSSFRIEDYVRPFYDYPIFIFPEADLKSSLDSVQQHVF